MIFTEEAKNALEGSLVVTTKDVLSADLFFYFNGTEFTVPGDWTEAFEILVRHKVPGYLTIDNTDLTLYLAIIPEGMMFTLTGLANEANSVVKLNHEAVKLLATFLAFIVKIIK